MVNLRQALSRKEFKPNHRISYQWQDRAYQIWSAFKLSRKELPNLFRFFKFNYPKFPGAIEDAYSFTVDYEGTISKLKLFYWKFNQLKISSA